MRAPDYLWNYRCNLKGCCCRGWRISFREYDVHRLRAAARGTPFEAELREAIHSKGPDAVVGVVPPPGSSVRFPDTYADVVFDARGTCRFLTEQGTCGVHEALGEAALPDLCANFPVVGLETPEGIECYFEWICPEVQRCLIEAPDRARVTEAPPTFNRRVHYFSPSRPRTSVWLTRNTAVPWDDFARFRSESLALFGRDDPPLTLFARIFARVQVWATASRGLPLAEDDREGTTLAVLGHLADIATRTAGEAAEIAGRLGLARQFLVHLPWPADRWLNLLGSPRAPGPEAALDSLARLGDGASRVFQNYLLARVFGIPLQNEDSLLEGYLSLAETLGVACYLAGAFASVRDEAPSEALMGVALALADFLLRARKEAPFAFAPSRRLPATAIWSARPGEFADLAAVARALATVAESAHGFSGTDEALTSAATLMRRRLRVALRDHASEVRRVLEDPSSLRALVPWNDPDDPLVLDAMRAEATFFRRLAGTGPSVPITWLRSRLGLSDPEVSVVLLLLLAATDTRWARALTHAGLNYASRDMDRTTMKVLLGPEAGSLLKPSGRLVRLLVVHPDASGTRFRLDPSLTSVLLGDDEPPLPDDLARLAPEPDRSANLVPIPDAVVTRLRGRLSVLEPGAAVVLLRGGPGYDPRALVRECVGAEPIALRVRDAAAWTAGDGRVARIAARESLLRQRPILLFLDDEAAKDAGFAETTVMVAGVISRPLLVSCSRRPVGLDGRTRVLDIPIPSPSTAYLLAVAARAAPREVNLPDPESLRRLVTALPLPPSRLAAAVSGASGAALIGPMHPSGHRRRPSLTMGALARCLRDHVRARIGDLADVVPVGQGMEDLVLPDESLARLREMIAGYRHREKVLREWGFAQKVGRGGGWTALFHGPPGTGKTMAAGIVARELGLEVYRVDLSRVVDKYIGETEKHLARVFDEAERGQVMLLFDEADSLFGRRTSGGSATDRYANMEVNYLLQRMERYEGVVVLTTNNERLLDEAFRRRLRYVVHFPMPDVGERERIWRGMVPMEAEVEGDLDFAALARAYEMSGGHIRNAVLRAAYMAAEQGGGLSQERLRRAADAEYRALGRVIREEVEER